MSDAPWPTLPANATAVVLVTGSRDWPGDGRLDGALSRVLRELLDAGHDRDRIVVVHGAARGADHLAGRFADRNRVPTVAFAARWDDYPAAERWRAGRDRNEAMLAAVLAARDAGATVVVRAFKEDFDWSLRRGGTEHMVGLVKAAGLDGRVVGSRRPQPTLL